MSKEKELAESLNNATIAVRDFFQMCNYFFGDNPPYEVKDIPENNAYHKLAVEICDEMQIDWDAMTHEDSNRIILAMLDDYFNQIRESADEKVCIEIKASKIEKKNGKDSTDTEG